MISRQLIIQSKSQFQICLPSYPSCSILLRAYSSDEKVPFYKRIFSKKKETSAEQIEAEIAQKAEIQMQQEMAAESREREIELASRRSRLFYSDNLLVQNKMPHAGIEWEKNDDHRSREFKSMMLSRFGKKTKVNPSVAWPTDQEVEEQKEYEKVLYDGLSLSELIKEAQKKAVEEEEAIAKREKELAAKMAKHEDHIKAWQRRVESRNVVADREKKKREQILSEVSGAWHLVFNLDLNFALSSIFSFEKSLGMISIQTILNLLIKLPRKKRRWLRQRKRRRNLRRSNTSRPKSPKNPLVNGNTYIFLLEIKKQAPAKPLLNQHMKGCMRYVTCNLLDSLQYFVGFSHI